MSGIPDELAPEFDKMAKKAISAVAVIALATASYAAFGNQEELEQQPIAEPVEQTVELLR